MGGKRKFTLKEVKHYIEIESGSMCNLSSLEYINSKSKLDLICRCGNKFKTSFSEFKNMNKRQCNSCSTSSATNKLLLNIKDIKRYIEIDSGSGCKLLSDKYGGAKSNLNITCRCGNEFKTTFSSFKTGKRQCNICGGAGIKWDIDKVRQFVEENSDCELLSTEYVNNREKLEFRCFCGEEFKTTFGIFNYHNKRQCNECGYKKTSLSTKKKYADIKHFVEIESKSGCKLLSDVYTGYSDRNLVMQCVCGEVFTTSWNNFYRVGKRQCNECGSNIKAKKKLKTNQWFLKEVYNLVGDEYTLLEKYKGMRFKIRVKHNKCGNEYYVHPGHFLKGCRCPKCRRPNYHRDTDQFRREVAELSDGEYSLIGEYIGSDDHTLIRHNICGHEWSIIPYAFLRGVRCPICKTVSRGEKAIIKMLKCIDLTFIHQKRFHDCIHNRQLPFDFYIPSLNLCIEYQGEQHYNPVSIFGGDKEFNKTRLRDYIKTNYCRQHNIPLLRIPYWEFDNIEEILHSELSKYGLLDDNNIKTAI